MIISKCLNLFKGSFSYKGCCLQHLLRFVNEYVQVEFNIEFQLYKVCLKLASTLIVSVKQGHFDLYRFTCNYVTYKGVCTSHPLIGRTKGWTSCIRCYSVLMSKPVL
jgi:hypothetical protein